MRITKAELETRLATAAHDMEEQRALTATAVGALRELVTRLQPLAVILRTVADEIDRK